MGAQKLAGAFGDEFDDTRIELQENGNGGGFELPLLTGSVYLGLSTVSTGFCLMSYYNGNSTRISFGRVGGDSFLLKKFANKVEERLNVNIRELASTQALPISEEHP